VESGFTGAAETFPGFWYGLSLAVPIYFFAWIFALSSIECSPRALPLGPFIAFLAVALNLSFGLMLEYFFSEKVTGWITTPLLLGATVLVAGAGHHLFLRKEGVLRAERSIARPAWVWILVSLVLVLSMVFLIL